MEQWSTGLIEKGRLDRDLTTRGKERTTQLETKHELPGDEGTRVGEERWGKKELRLV